MQFKEKMDGTIVRKEQKWKREMGKEQEEAIRMKCRMLRQKCELHVGGLKVIERKKGSKEGRKKGRKGEGKKGNERKEER